MQPVLSPAAVLALESLSSTAMPRSLSGATRAQVTQEADPLAVPARLSATWRPSTLMLEELPPVFTGGWVGYTGYDTVRYVFPGAGRLQRACAGFTFILCFLEWHWRVQLCLVIT